MDDFKLVYVLLCCLCCVAQEHQTMYFSPIANDTSLPEKLAVFVPGGLVPLENYIPTIKVIQQNSKTRLWVSLVYCLAYLCDPYIDLNSRILGAISGTKDLGFSSDKSSDIFILGHSLGGVGARHFIDTVKGPYGGLGLYGTQYNGSLGYPSNLANFGVPLLALTGELDMLPITHTAILYSQYLQLPTQKQYINPVIVVPGMDHSAFCPGFNVSGDIQQEIDEKDALSIIGKVTGAWIDVLSYPSPPPSSISILSSYNSSTLPIVQSYLEARKVESAQWCATAQNYLSGLPAEKLSLLKISVATPDSIIGLIETHTNYSVGTDGVLSVTSVSEPFYQTGFSPKNVGASEIACKAISAERVAQQLKLSNSTVNFNVVCSDINQLALTFATNLLKKYWPNSVARFNIQGIPFQFDSDIVAIAGPVWVFEALSWNQQSNPQVLSVASISIKTDLDSFIYPGVHYCKLMSPARAVEWIMTQGLTNRF